MSIELSNKAIYKYFKFLTSLNNGSKKRLIIKLTESIKEEKNVQVYLKNLYGSWDDDRSYDEIIKEIRYLRVINTGNFD